jgi:hypothetical protein
MDSHQTVIPEVLGQDPVALVVEDTPLVLVARPVDGSLHVSNLLAVESALTEKSLWLNHSRVIPLCRTRVLLWKMMMMVD